MEGNKELMVENVDEEVPVKEYADYIDKHFLASFLSEDSDELIADLNNLRLQETITYQDISDLIVKMEGMNVSDVTRLHILESLTDLFTEWVDAESQIEDHSLLEYAGNPEKNRALRELMVAMEKSLSQYYDECEFVFSSLDKIFDIAVSESKKKDPNAKKAALEVKKVYDKVDSDLSSDEYKEYVKSYNKVFGDLKKICKKFSIKFNDVVMEDKKAFDKKLEAAFDKLYKNKSAVAWFPTDGNNSGSAKVKEVNSALEILRIDNSDATSSILSSLQTVYNYAYTVLNGYLGNINYLRKVLGLEKENGTFYKVLNKVFKTKKED